MSPQILHRYRIPFAEIIAAMTPETAVSAVVARIEGDAVILDIEQPASAPQAAPAVVSSAEPAKGGPIARRAAILCAQGGFQAFLDVASEAVAADVIRRECGIGSRAELDHSDAAAGRFREIEARPASGSEVTPTAPVAAGNRSQPRSERPANPISRRERSSSALMHRRDAPMAEPTCASCALWTQRHNYPLPSHHGICGAHQFPRRSSWLASCDLYATFRGGKKAAGALLDGIEHKEFPE